MKRSRVVPDRGTPMITGIGTRSSAVARRLCSRERDSRNGFMPRLSPVFYHQFTECDRHQDTIQPRQRRESPFLGTSWFTKRLLRYRTTLTAYQPKHNLAKEQRLGVSRANFISLWT